jgi:molecular chaperone IbpA
MPSGGEDEGRVDLHRGIATRVFERRFHLADHVRVTGASHVNGMLHIDLVREVPEALKPRRIEITAGDTVDVKAVEAETVN